MKLYYYKCPDGNFGDDLNSWLWEELTPGIWNDSNEAISVSGIGTIIGEHMPPSRRWLVMSSGTGYAPAPENFRGPGWNIICVRGPLTAEVLGLPPEKAATDGAILVSLLPQYQPVAEDKRHGIVFMPHYSKTLKLGRWQEVCKKTGIEFLDPRWDSKYLLDRIRHAKLVLAEAMHAAIVADAVRVPWVPLTISSETNNFKWLDWTLSMELPYKPIALPASGFLEDSYSRIMSALKLHHAFPDLSAAGAIRHYHHILRNKEGFSAEYERLIIGKVFGGLRMLSRLPVIESICRRLDRKRLERAAVSLREASETQPFCSRPEVFEKKKEDMQSHLETLKLQSRAAEELRAESAVEHHAPVPANSNAGALSFLRKKVITGHALNTLLRLVSLGAKLVFTLYMGRYLGLDEMGTYGLITAYVAILVTLLGVRFDYVVSRDIVDAAPLEVACKIRDQAIFYGLNYLALAAVVGLALLGPLKGANIEIVLFTFSLSVLESFAAITSGNFISLKRPIFANVLFFIRAALWTFPVMALGILYPKYRMAEPIFVWWAAGVSASLLVTFVAWRNLPWVESLQRPVDWGWIKTGVRKCFLIWLGVIGATGATYVDRFVVERYLGLDYVGIASFYGSFVMAIQSLLQSGVFAFSSPRLISHHRENADLLFRHEVWRMTSHAMLFAGIMALGVGVAVPLMGQLFHRPEFANYAPTLWLMLLGVWLRSSTEGLYYVLYARYQDRIIWTGGLLMLIPAFGANMLFVPLAGFKGIGYSAVVTAIFLCVWRVYCVMQFQPAETENAILAAESSLAE